VTLIRNSIGGRLNVASKKTKVRDSDDFFSGGLACLSFAKNRFGALISVAVDLSAGGLTNTLAGVKHSQVR